MIEITHNPYDGVDWSSVTLRKFDYHIHAEDEFWDGPHETIDWYLGNRESDNGYFIPSGEEYDYLTSSVGSETYWEGDDGWEFSAIDSEFEDRDPVEEGTVAFPSMEDKDPKDGGCGREYHPYSLFADIDDTDEYENETMYDAIENILDATDQGVPEPRSVIAHPARHYDGDPADHVEDFTEYFEDFPLDGLWGLECFNKAMDPWRDSIGCEDSTPFWSDVALWDHLLMRFAPNRMIWGFGADDASNPHYGDYLDRRFNAIALEEDEYDVEDQDASRQAAVDAIDQGRFFACRRETWDPEFNSPPEIPVIESIDVDESEGEITVEVEQDNAEVYWISGPATFPDREPGNVVETGETIQLEDFHAPYVRAHVIIENSPIGETTTQPFGVTGGYDVELGDAELGDGEL